jgi:CHAT domain-containing protein
MRSSPNSANVVRLRADIQDDPGPDAANDEALRGLDGHRRFGDMWMRMDELLQNGYDHLLVVPHGPGHYLPWHLLGGQDQPLAERCAVSVLPNLALLQHSSYTDLAMAILHKSPPASLGLSYRTVCSGGMGRLPHGEDEAVKVADTMGVTAIVEEQVTVAAVIDALENARYVHLAAHGRHNADAAAFQSIQLAGTPSRLTAHRLSTLDLRGLRLVTLGACETALGRFDRADNVRGIPAALFLAGVRSIVGTLWQARDSAAEVFFVALYRQLIEHRATVAGAFRTAQQETRCAFPAYRDWGAFVLMGGLPEKYSFNEVYQSEEN